MTHGTFGPAWYGFRPVSVQILDATATEVFAELDVGASSQSVFSPSYPPTIRGRGDVTFQAIPGDYTLRLVHANGVIDDHLVTVDPPPASSELPDLGSTYVRAIVHGADATVDRPFDAVQVHWVGSVQPTRAVADDEWTDTANEVLKRYTGSTWESLGSPNGGSVLVPTAVKTANYTLAAGDLVPFDTTSGSLTGTLPTAPADKTQVAAKHVVRGGTNTVTIAAGGSDKFNVAGGSTTLTLTLLNQAVILQYTAATALWYVLADDLALSQLDARFSPVVGAGRNATTGWYHVSGYGAKADAQVKKGTGSSMTSGSAVFTDSAGTFAAADVGKVMVVCNALAAGTHLYTTILSRQSATQVTLAASATATISGAYYTYGTDDTAARDAALTDAVAAGPGNTVLLPSTPFIVTTAAAISANVNVIGTGYMPLFGSQNDDSGGGATLNMPIRAPFLAGSVYVVAAANTDAFDITATGSGYRIGNFGILFAGLWRNTGHGVYHNPPSYNTGRDNGMMAGAWFDMFCYGHDGNHYGFYAVNTLYSDVLRLRGIGGGILKLDNNSSVSSGHYGNISLHHIYGQICLNGSAHGIHLAVTTSGLNMIEFFQVQCNAASLTTLFPGFGLADKSAGQHEIQNDGASNTDYLGADFETGGQTTMGANWISPGSSLAGASPQTSQYPGILASPNMSPGLVTRPKLTPDFAVISPRTDVIGKYAPGAFGVTQGGYADPNGRPVYSDGVAEWRYYDGTVAYVAGTPGGAGTDPASVAGGPLDDWNVNALGLTDGATITSLTDAAAGAHALVPITGTVGPVYKTGTCNGLAVARFTSATNTLLQAAFTLPQPITVFLVMRTNAVDGTLRTVFDGATAETSFAVSGGNYVGGQTFIYAGSLSCLANSTPSFPAWKIITVQINGASSLIRSNGTQIASGNGGSNTPGGFTLGGMRDKTALAINTDIARVILFNQALSAGNMTAVERFIGNTYAIAAA